MNVRGNKDPGNESHNKWTCADVRAAAIRDGLRPLNADGCCDKGYCKVKYYVQTPSQGKADYHWERLDSNGKWSSKHGRGGQAGGQYDNPDSDAAGNGGYRPCKDGTLCAPENPNSPEKGQPPPLSL